MPRASDSKKRFVSARFVDFLRPDGSTERRYQCQAPGVISTEWFNRPDGQIDHWIDDHGRVAS